MVSIRVLQKEGQLLCRLLLHHVTSRSDVFCSVLMAVFCLPSAGKSQQAQTPWREHLGADRARGERSRQTSPRLLLPLSDSSHPSRSPAKVVWKICLTFDCVRREGAEGQAAHSGPSAGSPPTQRPARDCVALVYGEESKLSLFFADHRRMDVLALKSSTSLMLLMRPKAQSD